MRSNFKDRNASPNGLGAAEPHARHERTDAQRPTQRTALVLLRLLLFTLPMPPLKFQALLRLFDTTEADASMWLPSLAFDRQWANQTLKSQLAP